MQWCQLEGHKQVGPILEGFRISEHLHDCITNDSPVVVIEQTARVVSRIFLTKVVLLLLLAYDIKEGFVDFFEVLSWRLCGSSFKIREVFSIQIYLDQSGVLW